MASGKLQAVVQLITRGKTRAEVHRALNVAQLTCLPWQPQNRRRTAAVLRHEGEEALQLTQLEKEGSKTKRFCWRWSRRRRCFRRWRLPRCGSLPMETSVERRCRAVVALEERPRASERKACQVLVKPCCSQCHGSVVVSLQEAKLRHRLREIAAESIRLDRPMACRLLRQGVPFAGRSRSL